MHHGNDLPVPDFLCCIIHEVPPVLLYVVLDFKASDETTTGASGTSGGFAQKSVQCHNGDDHDLLPKMPH